MEKKHTVEISLVSHYLANYNHVIVKDGKLTHCEPIMSKKYPSINAAFTLYEFGNGQQIDPVNIGDIQKWLKYHTVIGIIRYYKTIEGYKVEAYYPEGGDYTILYFDEQGLLHNENGPAVAHLGMGGEENIYAVHGEYVPKMFNRFENQYAGKVSLDYENDTLVKSSEYIDIEDLKNYEGPAYLRKNNGSTSILTIDGVVYSDMV